MDVPERIGQYPVERELGRGGMGVVYLATDPRLGRRVAIKALPDHMAEDADRLARFDREARSLASLSHPNVAQIYGVEEDDGRRFLVLEYVEGETLAESLDSGALSLDDALDVAMQVARGVEAAHAAGVIHRDLKPGNIKVTGKGEVKVLDFGLAKATERSGVSSSGSLAATGGATATAHTPRHGATEPGAILGTAYYMSPEQARGRPVDERSDIWSLGVILYEMLTGAGPFVGETATDVLGAILHVDPNWSRLPDETPATVQLLLRRCLQRDRKRRLQSIGDARVELESAIEDPSGTSLGLAGEVLAARGRRGVPLWMVLVFVPLLVAVGVVGAMVLRSEAVPEVMHVGVPIPERFAQVSNVDISPDGRRLAMVAWERPVADENVESAIYVRELSETRFRKLDGTEGGFGVRFSPNGEWVAFAVPDKVRPVMEFRVVPIAGGPGLTWFEWTQRGLLGFDGCSLSDDELLFESREGDGLYRFGSAGGKPQLAARFEMEPGDEVESVSVPRLGGRFAVVTRWSAASSSSDLWRVDLETGETARVLENARNAQFRESGRIVFERNETLWAAPFDLDSAEVTGPPRLCLSGFLDVRLARNADRAVYRASSDLGSRESIVLVDSAGKVVKTLVDAPADYEELALSPDGRRLGYVVVEEEQSRLWVLDIASGIARPITPEGEWVASPVWTPDGRIAFSRSYGPEHEALMVMQATLGATPERVLPTAGDGPVQQSEGTFSPDGRHVIVSYFPDGGREPGIYAFDVGDGDSSRAFFASQAFEGNATFRPDGKWVAYYTNSAGRGDVYLRPFLPDNPESAPIYPVSRDGGFLPSWSADGATLYYRSRGDDEATMFAVTVQTEPELKISEPRVVLSALEGAAVVPTPDGRFIREMAAEGAKDQRPDIRLILNWGLGQE